LKKNNYVLFVGLLVLLVGVIVSADTDFYNRRTWPPILDLNVSNLEVSVANVNLDSMNASLAANNFEPIVGPLWGYGYGTFTKKVPHDKVNFGLYTTQLFKTTVKGVKKASFGLHTVRLQANKDFGNKAFTLSPKAGVGLSFVTLSLRHKEVDDIYFEPREAIDRGFYISGSVGFNVHFNVNQIFAFTGSAEYFGGYKLFKPIQDLDSYTGFRFGLGLVTSLPF